MTTTKMERHDKPLTKQVPVRMDHDLHRQVKVFLAQQGTTFQDWLLRLIEEALRKNP